MTLEWRGYIETRSLKNFYPLKPRILLKPNLKEQFMKNNMDDSIMTILLKMSYMDLTTMILLMQNF